MNVNKLRKTFTKFGKVEGVDFSIYNIDKWGDCCSCAGASICEKYGDDCIGIYRKHWLKGMSKGVPVAELDRIIVGHQITEEVAKKFYEIFGEEYNIEPEKYDENICFTLTEK